MQIGTYDFAPLTRATPSVISLEVSPLDDGFMSGSLDNTVRLWDLRTPNCRVCYPALLMLS